MPVATAIKFSQSIDGDENGERYGPMMKAGLCVGVDISLNSLPVQVAGFMICSMRCLVMKVRNNQDNLLLTVASLRDTKLSVTWRLAGINTEGMELIPR